MKTKLINYYTGFTTSTKSVFIFLKVLNICIDENNIPKKIEYKQTDTENTLELNSISKSQLEVYPNPTTNDWNVKILSDNSERAEFLLRDYTSKLIYKSIHDLIKGENNIVVPANKLKTGMYILEIKGKSINFIEKLIKN